MIEMYIFVFVQTSFIYVIELSKEQYDFLKTTTEQNLFPSSEGAIKATEKLDSREINLLTVDIDDEQSKTSKLFVSDDSKLAQQMFSVLDPTRVDGYPKGDPPNRLGYNESGACWKDPGMKAVDHLTKKQEKTQHDRYWGVIDGWHRVVTCQVCLYIYIIVNEI